MKKEELKDNKLKPIWFFKEGGALGEFEAPYAQFTSKLYFPLMNEKGLKTYVTPELKGDICTDYHHYLTVPNVTEDLHRQAPGRNFWIHLKGKDPWSVSGQSVFQKNNLWRDPEKSKVTGKPGVFELQRIHPDGLEVTTTLFVSITENVEIMLVKVHNKSDETIRFKAYNATPIYGRSADHVRDHRQVTTMFQETAVDLHGVRVKPRMVHNEEGHVKNDCQYVVYGFDKNGNAPIAVWPSMTDFIGEGGSLENPEVISKSLPAKKYSGYETGGSEAIGAFRFEETFLTANSDTHFVVISGISEDKNEIDRWSRKYANQTNAFIELSKTESYWKRLTEKISIESSNKNFDHSFKWVIYQVKCRQIFGNSFLPDYGYGKGGRGWRDLWQDLLAVFLIDPKSAQNEILNNFLGIRFDGSNATIIGEKSGEFKADRNNIPRTWSDHGAWPVFVTDFYLNQTGDYTLLLEYVPYWKDQHIFRSQQQDQLWERKQGNQQLDSNNKIVLGSVFEHLLLQQLSAFYHVGQHNIVKLEGADWNDTYDMASKEGETVCFHHFYAGNFLLLVKWLQEMKKSYKMDTMEIHEEILILLDRVNGQTPIDYTKPQDKRERLNEFFKISGHTISGRKRKVSITEIIEDLEAKGDHMKTWVSEKEWHEMDEQTAFFNGHYDDFGQAFDGDFGKQTRIDLTSQVIPIMLDSASDKQIPKMFSAVNKLLKEPGEAAFRLCTDFGEFDTRYGRVSGFVYGYKEHGSRWMQQNIMLGYGLYHRGFVKEAHEVLIDIQSIMDDSGRTKSFPGVSSFMDNEGRGAYNYLTGSSSWLMMLIATQLFGVRGEQGHLRINPKLLKTQFGKSGEAKLNMWFRNKQISIHFKLVSPGEKSELRINDKHLTSAYVHSKGWLIDKQVFDKATNKEINIISILIKE